MSVIYVYVLVRAYIHIYIGNKNYDVETLGKNQLRPILINDNFAKNRRIIFFVKLKLEISTLKRYDEILSLMNSQHY